MNEIGKIIKVFLLKVVRPYLDIVHQKVRRKIRIINRKLSIWDIKKGFHNINIKNVFLNITIK